MKRLSLTLTLLLTAIATASAASFTQYKHSSSRSYPVDSAHNISELYIDVDYSTVKIIRWDKNEVQVNAKGKFSSTISEVLQELQSCVDISFSSFNGKGVIKSIFDGNTIDRLKRKGKLDYDIAITIYVPQSIEIELNTNYSNFHIENVSEVSGNCNYTDITARHILDEVEIDGNYSDVIVEGAGKAQCDLNYSDLLIDNTYSVEVESNYSDIVVRGVTSMEAEINYSELKVTMLSPFRELEVDASYSDIEIDLGITREFVAEIEADYSDVVFKTFGYESNVKRKFDSFSVGTPPIGMNKLEFSGSYSDFIVVGR